VRDFALSEPFLSLADFQKGGLPVDIHNGRLSSLNHIANSRAPDMDVEGGTLPAAIAALRERQNPRAIRTFQSSLMNASPIGGRQKRVFDMMIALAALAMLTPVLALLAVAVKISMGGPVLYRHRRIGFNGRSFDCLKFRTMVTVGDRAFQDYLDRNPAAADEWRTKRKLENDPRVTRIGRFLRKTSLDELPQFINVLRGEMSLVGPRPVVRQELELYGALVSDYMRARPGVTGLWQVSGRSSLSFEQRIALDSTYVRDWALAKDIIIMMQTLPAIFKTPHAV